MDYDTNIIRADYYQTLGVHEKATTDDINKAANDLAKRFSLLADLGDPRAMERYGEVMLAREVLARKDTRDAYDAHGFEAALTALAGPVPPATTARRRFGSHYVIKAGEPCDAVPLYFTTIPPTRPQQPSPLLPHGVEPYVYPEVSAPAPR